MADSSITKRALAEALKQLMEEKPFEKITVSDICAACEMNRKSLYYHFKDKFDLANWIFYSEFAPRIRDKKSLIGWTVLDELCDYLYENRRFYRKLLAVEGQNSLLEYINELLQPVTCESFMKLTDETDDVETDNVEFYADFYLGAALSAIKRWLLDENCAPAAQFTYELKKCFIDVSRVLVKYYGDEFK